MCRNAVIIYLLTGFTVSALEMVIEIEDDDGHREKYNITEELDELMKDHLPFDVPDESMDEEYKAKLRPRRDTASVQNQVPWNRNLPECEKYIENYRKQNRGAPLQLMYSVEEHEDIVLTCHYCGDKETYGKTIEWKKLDRKKAKGREFRIVRIDIDMHDDDNDNRVYIDEEYGLHIKNATTADRGTYFCHDMKTEDVYVKKFLDVNMLKNFFFSSDRFRVFFHLEVIQETDIPIRKVDKKGKKFSKPLPEQVSKQDNLVYYSSWGDWTPCSVCGAEGERKRRGTCMAKLYSERQMIENYEQLYYILRSYKAGLPCRSSMFERYYYRMSKYRDRPDEMEYKSCHVQCWKGGSGGKKFASVKLDKIEFTDVMKKFPETTVIATEGDRVDLICPGSSIDTLVYWINGTKYMSSLKLREKMADRVEIDAYNVFVIHTSLVEDSHSYTCSYAGKTRMIFHLKVLPPPGLPPWIEHLIYLCYSFTVDFWVFVIFLVVRHKHRLVAHTKKRFKPVIDVSDEDENNNVEVQTIHRENEALLHRDFDEYSAENEALLTSDFAEYSVDNQVLLASNFDELSNENEVVLRSDFDEYSPKNEFMFASDFDEFSAEDEVVSASDFNEYSQNEEVLMPNNKYFYTYQDKKYI
ncbi:uncharacterized protein LOC134685002 isoform X1 [Mytilus trossulus]|uniref:uncharacterized protein LOC134685002 isoform X1 n=2 Tax=Mytilus trossulus TaxID=6551 RepID=UPI003006BFD5